MSKPPLRRQLAGETRAQNLEWWGRIFRDLETVASGDLWLRFRQRDRKAREAARDPTYSSGGPADGA